MKKLRHHCESLREGITRSRLLMQQAAAIAEQLAMVQQTETTQRTHFKTVSEQLQQLQQQRATLLKGKPADEAEAWYAVKRRS